LPYPRLTTYYPFLPPHPPARARRRSPTCVFPVASLLRQSVSRSFRSSAWWRRSSPTAHPFRFRSSRQLFRLQRMKQAPGHVGRRSTQPGTARSRQRPTVPRAHRELYSTPFWLPDPRCRRVWSSDPPATSSIYGHHAHFVTPESAMACAGGEGRTGRWYDPLVSRRGLESARPTRARARQSSPVLP
jgi:hypothetical protein